MLQVFDIRAPLPRPGLSPVCVCVRARTLGELGRCVCWSAGLSVCRPCISCFQSPSWRLCPGESGRGLHLAPEARALGLPLPQGFRRC